MSFEPHRDVTLGASTVAGLRQAHHALTRSGHPRSAAAVADVIERWDANDATEELLDPQVATGDAA